MAKEKPKGEWLIFRDKSGAEVPVKWSRYIRKTNPDGTPFVPTPHQLLCMMLDNVEEILLGGAAGPGKSIGLLLMALQWADIPGYRACIVRSELQTQKDQLIPVAQEWLCDSDAKWKSDESKWIFPGGGCLKFGHLAGGHDLAQYKGNYYDFMGVDEPSEIKENDLMFLNRCLGRKRTCIPPRFRLASNPGGVSHEYLKQTYVKGADNITGKRPIKRMYIPCKFSDNPHLGERYIDFLNKLDPFTAAQMRDGNWDICAAGNLWRPFYHETYDHPLPYSRVVRYWDLAATAKREARHEPCWSVGVKGCLSENETIGVLDRVKIQAEPGKVIETIVSTAQMDGADCEIWMELEGGSGGKFAAEWIEDQLRARLGLGYPLYVERPKGTKESRFQPVSTHGYNKRIWFQRGEWNQDFDDRLLLAPDDGRDEMDSFSGMFRALTTPLGGFGL